MKLIDYTLHDFIQAVDAQTAIPGGGSVAALSGALGAGLVGMVGKLTVQKKKFLALDAEIQTLFKKRLETIEKIKVELENCVDKDTEAYQLVMNAYQLPKNTPEEVALRNDAIIAGTKEAIKVPFEVARICLEALSYLETIALYGNNSAASDLGVAAMMLESALNGAILNVRTNLSGLDVDVTRYFYENNSAEMPQKARAYVEQILKLVATKMK